MFSWIKCKIFEALIIIVLFYVSKEFFSRTSVDVGDNRQIAGEESFYTVTCSALPETVNIILACI